MFAANVSKIELREDLTTSIIYWHPGQILHYFVELNFEPKTLINNLKGVLFFD